ncbi:DUF5777 family beta-barrel protein, partial [bacterium]|nr:DUF5777 family beta-barrel protein [bacterium]
LEMNISHRFGKLNGGDDSPFYQLFGLDQANMRIGLQYGVQDWLTVGVGRANIGKTYDGFVKAKFLRQSTGKNPMPVTMALVGGTALKTLKIPGRDFELDERMAYTGQLLIARKFNERFSLQLMPTYVHRNVVPLATDDNGVFALGAGGRIKLTKGVSLNLEYYYVISEQTSNDARNSLSVGFDIETGGHVFQLFFTNSQGMTENYFVPGDDPSISNGDWSNGDVHFGFNISRVFNVNSRR